MSAEKNKSVNLVSVTGVNLMSLEGIERDKDRLSVRGSFMGAVPIAMYIQPDEIWKMLGLLLKPKLIGYFFCLPFILLAQKLNKKQIQAVDK